MPSRAWYTAWGDISISDERGLESLIALDKKRAPYLQGPEEMASGTIDGCTLMHQAAFHGRVQCVNFLLSHGITQHHLYMQSGSRRHACDYAKFNETDIYDAKRPEAPPTRPHSKIYNKLRLSMGEYVEKDMALGTPGISNWQGLKHEFNADGVYKIPHQWKPDRPYFPVRDKDHVRKRPAHLDEE